MVWTALEAAEQLAQEGASVEVVDLRTLVPLDRETVCESVKKTSKVLLLHEDTRTGGMAGELAVTITESVFEYLDGPDCARHGARYAGAVQSAARRSVPAERRQGGGEGALAVEVVMRVAAGSSQSGWTRNIEMRDSPSQQSRDRKGALPLD